MKQETAAIHAGNEIDKSSRAVIQPVTLSTTFERGADGGYPEGYAYTRAGNPNRRSLENVVARLENGEDACAFSSGNAAGCAIFQALGNGAHVIAPEDMYHGLRAQLLEVFKDIIEVDFADMSDLGNIKSLIKKETRLLWIETPSNPLLKISDIRGITALAASRNILTACDNTFATPVFQRPLELGCDLVMHSSTKYLGGHSDVLGGVVVTSKQNDIWKQIRNIQALSGAVPSPFDCYLTVRGIKTLPYRMRGHAANALAIASYLEKHSAVEQVFYPGLPSHQNYELGISQMTSPGGMLSFLIRGGEEKARAFVNAVQLFTQATSLGGVESLIEHRASIEGPDTKTPLNLVRVSVGLEHQDDLIADLKNAFNSIS